MRPQPLITVGDVPASSQWYQSVLGLRSGHGGAEYEQLFNTAGVLVLQLHHWDAHDHVLLGDESVPIRGNGSIVWFETDDFGDVLRRVDEHHAEIAEGPLENLLAQHREIWLRDLDGYIVVVASVYGTI